MADLFLLSQAQMRRIERYFPLSHGVARVDDRRIVSAIVFVIKNGLRWRDAPGDYGPHKTIYNRFVRWSRLGVFNKIFAELARKGGKPERIMIDRHASEGAPHRCEPFKKGPVPRRIGRTKGGLNSKLHAVCDGRGRPLVMLLSEGQMSDYRGPGGGSPPCPTRPGSFQPTRATTPIGCAPRSQGAGSPPASPRNPIERSRSPMTPSSTSSATGSKTRSDGLKTGGASIPATTAALIPTSRQSASPQPSFFGSDQ